jgi:hypothetical protein
MRDALAVNVLCRMSINKDGLTEMTNAPREHHKSGRQYPASHLREVLPASESGQEDLRPLPAPERYLRVVSVCLQSEACAPRTQSVWLNEHFLHPADIPVPQALHHANFTLERIFNPPIRVKLVSGAWLDF